MKNLVLTLSIFLVGTLSLFAQKKVAVVTFYVDKNIDFSNLGGAAGMAAAVGQLAEDPNFDLQPSLEMFHKAFFEQLKQHFPFEIVDEAIVTGNEAYQAYENIGTDEADESKGIWQSYQVIEGYKPLMEVSKLSADKYRAELDMLKIFPDVDGVMFIRLDYSFIQKVAVGGMGSAGMAAWTRIKLYDREGNKVFAKGEQGTSKKSIGMVGGIPVMGPEDIQPLCEDATAKLVADLEKKMPKLVKKINKRFN